MSAYVYQEFPKVKYHPKLGTKTVQNADEEKALGKGWYNNPGEFPKPSGIVAAWNRLRAETWSRNDKIAVVAVVVTILLAVVALLTPEILRTVGLDKPVPVPIATLQGQSPKSELPSNPATAEPPVINQPAGAVAQPAPIPKKHRKRASAAPGSQDNSVHIDGGSKVQQESSGDCSPNIIGGANTVNCGPPEPKINWYLSKQWISKGVAITEIVFTLDHSIEIPAFRAKCDRPCKTDYAWPVDGGGVSTKLLHWDDHPNFAGVDFPAPRPLGAGVRILWVIESLDPNPVQVITLSVADQ